ncbi:hypothetical protein PUR49_08010 [Streptomyces sp. BE147]|nr:hypothetical protein [Streptomyces sp. BE147]MEE1736443.1 hypothetical protein [Streptomyces sp. BE147]
MTLDESAAASGARRILDGFGMVLDLTGRDFCSLADGEELY